MHRSRESEVDYQQGGTWAFVAGGDFDVVRPSRL